MIFLVGFDACAPSTGDTNNWVNRVANPSKRIGNDRIAHSSNAKRCAAVISLARHRTWPKNATRIDYSAFETGEFRPTRAEPCQRDAKGTKNAARHLPCMEPSIPSAPVPSDEA